MARHALSCMSPPLRTAALCVALALMSGCAIGMQPPIVPAEALDRGMEPVKMTYKRPFDTRGFQLGELRVEQVRRSEVVEGHEAMEVWMRDAQDRPWRASCLKEIKAESIEQVCSVIAPDGSSEASTGAMSVHKPRVDRPRGGIVGPHELRVTGWRPPLLDSGYIIGPWNLRVEDAAGGDLVALWDTHTVGWPTLWLSPDAAPDQRRWIKAVVLALTMSGDVIDESDEPVFRGQTQLDSRPLRKITRRSDNPAPVVAHASHIARLNALGLASGADLLKHKQQRDHALAIDMEAAPLIQTSPVRGPVLEVQVGGGLADDPDGGTAMGSTTLTVGGGLRFGEEARGQALIQMGMNLPGIGQSAVFDSPVPTSLYTQGRASSAGFHLGLTGRYAFSPVLGLEPVVGLGLQARVFSLDFDYSDANLGVVRDPNLTAEANDIDGIALGFSMAPLLGLQRAWELNDLGSRWVLFVEAAPQFTLWPARSFDTTLDWDEADRAVNTIDTAFGEGEFQVQTMFGIRLEM